MPPSLYYQYFYNGAKRDGSEIVMRNTIGTMPPLVFTSKSIAHIPPFQPDGL
jgi:hypothetical protein